MQETKNIMVRLKPELYQKLLKINSERQILEMKKISLGSMVNEMLEQSIQNLNK